MKRFLILYPDICTRCRSCEIACSFHFKKTFNPESSKIKINFNTKTGDLKVSIEKGCDKCKGEEEPLCTKYCATGAIILKK